MPNKTLKPLYIWGVKDCKWGTLRGVYSTKKEAREDTPCLDCKIIKLQEVKYAE